MPSCVQAADALKVYSDALENLRKKVQQDRSVHCQELQQVYAEAMALGAPQRFTDKVSQLVAERLRVNDVKMEMDALEWEEHDMKTHKKLGANQHVLSGGATALHHSGKDAKKSMMYAGLRSDAYMTNLHKKLMHDRQAHSDELKKVEAMSVRLMGGEAPMSKMLAGMVHNRKIYDARKTNLDAKQWGDVARTVKGGGCGNWLSAGYRCVSCA